MGTLAEPHVDGPSNAAQIERRHWTLFALLILLGAGLRLYRIEIPGFTEGADHMYALTARTMALLLGWGWQNAGLLADPHVVSQHLQQLFADLDHQPSMPYSCKPVFDLINALLITAIGYEDWVLSLSSAIAGVMGLGAIFLLGTRIHGHRVALVALALLSVSGGGVVFSRYGQSHMWSLVFFTLAFWAYCQSIAGAKSRRWLLLSAIGVGLALATHPNIAPYAGMLIVGEMALFVRGQCSMGEVIKRSLVAIGGVAGVVLVLNLPFVVIGYYAGTFFDQVEGYMHWPFMTYLEQLPHHFGLVFDKGHTPGLPERMYTYVVVLWAWEGLPVVGLVAAGVIWGIRRLRGLEIFDLLLLGQVSIPLLFWVLSENQAVYRFSAGALPSLMLVAACTLDRVAQRLSNRASLPAAWVLAGLCALLMAYNVQAISPLYAAQSAHKQAAVWLQGQGVERIAVNHSITWHFYGIEPIELGKADQVRYIAFYRRYMTARETEMLSALDPAQPIKVYAHNRPGKLLEVNFVRDSVVLKLLGYVPGIGKAVGQLRESVLSRNELRRLEIYQLQAGTEKFITQG